MAIDVTKPMKTQDGREVRGVFADVAFLYGFVKEGPSWVYCSWVMATGNLRDPQSDPVASSPTWDLVNVATRHIGYVNAYVHPGGRFYFGAVAVSAAAAAAQAGGSPRIACLRFEFDEGRFDP